MFVEGRSFTDPVPVDQGVNCPCAGVYIIIGKRSWEANWFAIYVGQTGDVDKRVGPSHHKWDCWRQKSSNPHVIFHAMRNSTEDQRRAVERALISALDPPCND
ncbi:MAG TPA: hypothetical protein DEA08_06330 [Planctomycetes bacterium]|nr:hypothetical protein [Planctomycetota bacterium]|tara:strand:- start:11 stop:319 length:309 start_codon:yes stop_codon:yes gene_type:complete